jgi:hypothetical protein
VSDLLHPIPLLGPLEKWGVDLMGPLLVIRRGHGSIMIAIDYFTKFVEIHALKSSVE